MTRALISLVAAIAIGATAFASPQAGQAQAGPTQAGPAQPAGRGQQPAPAGRGAAPAAPQAPRTSRSIAPIDLTGTWVSVVSEDWRWRMMTPPKGDYASLPLNAEGRRVADTWQYGQDDEPCKPFGAGGIMRMPGRMRVSWQDDSTMKLEFDAGTQTRLLHFSSAPPAGEARTLQGYSVATWEQAGQQLEVDRNGIPVGPARGGGGGGGGGGGRGRGGPPPVGGSLKVVTTNVRDGYLRKNGVPYSQDATITEYFDRLSYPNGDTVLVVRTLIEDPKFLQLPFVTSPNFKLERDASKFAPTPCRIDPPAERGK